MPVHGLKLDLEFAAIVLGAVAVSYFVTGQAVSNMLFTFLISVLFFLIGLHLDLDRVRNSFHHRKELALGWSMVYLIAPLLAFGIFWLVDGPVGEAFVAIGVSAAALGSPVVFSNLSKGEGDLALTVAATSLIAGFLVIPLLLTGFGTSIPVKQIAVKNLVFIAFPLATGVVAKRFENFLLDDLRHHFSKVALWLLVVVFLVQAKLVYASMGLAFLQEAATAAVLMAGFVSFSFAAAYGTARFLNVMEPKARALGFVSGSKGIAIALFIASQISGAAVAYVALYYFVRQAVCSLITEYFRHGELKGPSALLENIRNFLPASG